MAGILSAAPSAAVDTQGLAMLRIVPTRIAGWKEDTSRFKSFDRNGLFTVIDGGAPDYLDAGLIGGIVLELNGTDSVSSEIFVEDFGNAKASATMLAKKAEAISHVDTLAGYKKSEVIVEKVIGGCLACAGFGRYYFEVSMTGYSDYAKATKTAGTLLSAFQKQISSK